MTTETGVDVLKQEMETYEAHKDEMLQSSPGKYVLIKGSEIVGLYEREEDAFKEAYKRFRLDAFMVQRVQKEFATVYVGGSFSHEGD
jgi:hypothetical protein